MFKFEHRVFTLFTTMVVWVASLFASSVALSQSDLNFPYQALVLREGAKVHSGPAGVHYSTEELNQGAAVEVYRHDPNGWCAIRPTSGSFSLVPESTIQIVNKGVGRIKSGGTQAWVGTKLGPVEKPLWQVKLKQGELVEVIGQVSWPDPEGHSTVWVQIAPPAGEFRWIRISDIQIPAAARLEMQKQALKNSPKEDREETRQVRSLLDSPARTRNVDASQVRQASMEYGVDGFEQSDSNSRSTELSQPLSVPSNSGWRQASKPIPSQTRVSSNDRIGGFSSRGFDSHERIASRSNSNSGLTNTTPNNISRNNYPSSFGKSPDGRYRSESNPAEVPANRVANADLGLSSLARDLRNARSDRANNRMEIPNRQAALKDRMVDLEFSLTKEMVKEPVDWRLDDLELAATSVFRNSSDLSERRLADKFLTKIENCRKVQAGYKSGLDPAQTDVARRSRFNRTRAIGAVSQEDIELGTTYDAHGWLNQLIRNGGQSEPEYVLQDANGKVTHHVKPVQGMNLHRYLKSRVGIIGQRGYHNRLKLDHVTAHQVIELKRR